MADAATTIYGFTLPEVGASADTWGSKLNQVIQFLDYLLGSHATTGSADAYVLTTGFSLVGYVAGAAITVTPNFTNAGAATINIDTLGAKNIYKNSSGTKGAVAAGDLVSGVPIRLVYDGTQFVAQPNRDPQQADATLTALAALSWSSGSALVQFTAADTVALTLTPSVSSITASQGAAAATPSGTFVNTNNAASVRVARFEGDRATPASNDTTYYSYFMSDDGGTQKEFFRISILAAAVAAGSEDARVLFATLANGSLTTRLHLSASDLRPGSDAGLSLGVAGAGWSGVSGASGFTLNLNSGNVVLTHANTPATLEATTGRLVSPLAQVAAVSGTLVAATHRNRELLLSGNIQLDNSVFAAGAWGVLVGDGSDRTITRGSGVTMYVNGVDSATATLPARQVGGMVWNTASIVHLTGAIY